jgi:glucose/arabinose dehydrogenase
LLEKNERSIQSKITINQQKLLSHLVQKQVIIVQQKNFSAAESINYPCPAGNQKEQCGIYFEQPVYFWDPVLSPSGMTFYKSNTIPEWQNNLFIGGLNSHHIARIVLENRKVVGEERLLADQQQRFRAVIEGNDGELYVITDEGRLYRIGVGKNEI